MTGELSRINLNSAGSIHGREGATTTIEPLLASSPSAMAIDGRQRSASIPIRPS